MPGPEAQLSGAVREVLSLFGCHVYSTEAPRVRHGSGSTPGIADLIVLAPGGRGVWFVELKTPKGKLTERQRDFGRRVMDAGGRWLLWRSVEDAKDWCARYAPKRHLMGER